MRNAIASMLVALLLLGAALPLLVLDASGTRWEQTSADDFDDGESFFVNTDAGTLKLAYDLVEGWSIAGEGTDDRFGYSGASAGDVNGDGYDDVIVGAWYDASSTGKTYVWYGSSTGLASDSDASDADWSIAGEGTSDRFGWSVASAGDVNDDGYDDVIVGAYYDASYTGKAYVWHGSSTGLTDGDDAGDADWSIAGEGADDYFGVSVASAGDVNGDGYDDVIVGAYYDVSYTGKAYVWHGSSTGLTSGSDASDADWSIAGEGTSDRFGVSVASAGDVNGDGYDDVIVGASYDNGQTGKAYVWHGSATGLTDDSDASDADWSIAGEGGNDRFGHNVASTGDVNGDGYDDVIVGAHTDAGSTGKAYLWHGSATGLTVGDDAGDADWSIAGEGADDRFGLSVASAGDVNGDGYDDVIVGAYQDASYTGKTYIYSYGLTAALSAEHDWSTAGEGTYYELGVSVASAGDVNGDGYDDVIVGAQRYGSYKGKVYVWHGSATGLASGSTASSADWSIIGEGTTDYLGRSVASAGDVNGDGYDDVIVGAYIDSSGTGKAYVWHGSATGLASGSDASDANWSIAGEGSNNWFGISVASAGDVNDDGYDDVIVGASWYSSSTGRAYVWHGSSTGLASGSDAGDANWVITGQSNSRTGWSVASAGDVNGDGYADVIIGAERYDSNTGEAYVCHGSLAGLGCSGGAGIQTNYADWSIPGEAESDYFGNSVAGAGDVNGDGYADVVVGAYKNGAGGKVYVWYGSSTGLSDGDDASDADWSITAEASGDEFGESVASAGDVNGDGYDDVIVGARYNDDVAGSAGKAHLWHGSATGLASGGNAGNADAYIVAGDGSDNFGDSVASAGDVNGDGYADVIGGAYHGGYGYAGKANLWYGHGYIQKGMFDSSVLDADCTCGVDWQSLSWNPVVQPDGTSVKAQIGTSDDGVTWSWHGPDGSSTSYYTEATGQAIYSGDRGKLLRVHFIMESEYGTGGAVVGNLVSTHTPTVTDFTVSYLKFTTPTAILTWPNGGENLMHGESYAITWESEGGKFLYTPISLDYSLNGGSTWSSITSGTANDGNYLWTLPSNENVERALIRITATALDGSTVQDTSDGTFSIDPPEFWQTDDGDSEDMEPPVITMFPLGTATAGEPVTIRAEVSDETAVTQVALRYGDTEPVTVAMSPAGNGVWEVTLLPVEGELELVVIASDGTNVVETQSQTLSVGAASASGSSAGGSTIAITLVAGTALGLLVGISRRKT